MRDIMSKHILISKCILTTEYVVDLRMIQLYISVRIHVFQAFHTGLNENNVLISAMLHLHLCQGCIVGELALW